MLRIPHYIGSRPTDGGKAILYTVGLQMAVRLSALRAGHALLARKVIFLLLVLLSVRG
jgi:hypothetical protein